MTKLISVQFEFGHCVCIIVRLNVTQTAEEEMVKRQGPALCP